MRRGAGAYICGEESALLESIEGKRGLPRHKPPYPFQVGLFGLPTLINNIETLWWVRDIVEKGADWWKSQGRNDRHGLRSYSVSGRVKNPGMKLAPAGVTVRELIDEFCGGMADGHTFHAYLPGGASGGILPASMDDIPLDFGTLEKYGCFIGSAAVVILSDQDSVKDAALNLMRFFEDESCGQCTPCRVGTQKAALLMEQPVWNRELLDELSQAMRDASICGLGQAASNPLTSSLNISPRNLRRRRPRNDQDSVRTRRQAGRGRRQANPSGRSPSAKAPKSRICAIRQSPTIAPTAIAAPVWSRSRRARAGGVVQGAHQVLFGFLLAVPFSTNFKEISPFEEKVYFGTLLCTAISAALMIAPTAYHRLTFHLQQKRELIFFANRLSIAGLGFLALAMTGALMLITDVLFGGDRYRRRHRGARAMFVGLWYVLPLQRGQPGRGLRRLVPERASSRS